jgi:aspartyl-tRNA(Asn)/glutamyl-tRNA(Gln) amidotransferase subunit A
MNIKTLTIKEISAGLNKGEWSAEEITQEFLIAAKQKQKLTHAYVEIAEDSALTYAKESDKRRADGNCYSEFDGVPIAIKDNILVSGCKATAGSNSLKDYVAPYDATVIERLKARGLIILGKTNMDEFAMGSSTESSCHGPTTNPWDTKRVPGGSSGGSAAAVAEGSAPAALGSDTGGSIRQPAALCGVVGLKPTYGRVSRYGLIAMASSLDQIGVFSRSVHDAADLLRIIEGRDQNDSTSIELLEDWRLPGKLSKSIKGLKIGLPKEYFVSGMEPGVEQAVKTAVERFRELGAEVVEVSLPHSDYALAVYYIIMPCEVSANLARFDGVRYGLRVPGETLFDTYSRSRGQGFGPEVRRRIIIGTHALSSGYYDAYYRRALQVRRLISNDFTRAFADVDCILAPSSPTTAWKLGEFTDNPLAMYLQDIYTVAVNVAGLPAISLPCGLSAGLPVGFQLISRHFDEPTLLGVAAAYEQAAGGFATFVPNAGQ